MYISAGYDLLNRIGGIKASCPVQATAAEAAVSFRDASRLAALPERAVAGNGASPGTLLNPGDPHMMYRAACFLDSSRKELEYAELTKGK